MNNVVMIGAGNLATHLSLHLAKKGFRIVQVYSRTEYSAKILAEQVNAQFITSLAEIITDASLYICAVKDDALPTVLSQLPTINGIIVHTAGSVNMHIFENKTIANYGVFYPLQTFSKNKEVDFSNIPIFVEANNKTTLLTLKNIAAALSGKVYSANSEQRAKLHLSAIFACNFVNHLYNIADDIVQHAGFDFDVLLPLIDETAHKVHRLSPLEAQTGPAVRYDETVISKHLAMLGSSHDEIYQHIYRLLSDNIHKTTIPSK